MVSRITLPGVPVITERAGNAFPSGTRAPAWTIEPSPTLLPASHPLYHVHFDFPDGLPKIHEHDAKPAQGFGLFDASGRLCVFYAYESDLADGWEAAEVHHDPPEVRERALRMGVNLLVYAMTYGRVGS